MSNSEADTTMSLLAPSGGVIGIAMEAVEELLAHQRTEDSLNRLELQLDLREKFYSLVSHDLRTPLTAAKLNAELISRYSGNAESIQQISLKIRQAIERADRMIADLLDANRLRAGQMLPAVPIPCDLRELVEYTLKDMFILNPERCQLTPGEPLTGHWDPAGVRRALENLLSNALKYGQQGSLITVTLAQNEMNASIAVHNHGNELSPDEVAQLFKWHSRTSFARRSKSSGWGLGLMLVQGIAKAHGGGVSVESKYGMGTTIVIELPLDARPFIM